DLIRLRCRNVVSWQVRVPRSIGTAVLLGLALMLPATTQGSPPQITAQPQPRTALLGGAYTFSVSATGTAPLSYQWFRDPTGLIDQPNALLALTNIQVADAGGYSVILTNVDGAATSVVARLTVRLPTDPVYPAPQGGWSYLYGGDTAAG